MSDPKNKKTEFLEAPYASGGPPPPAPGNVVSSGPMSGQSTVMLDSASAAPRQMVTPTIMKDRPQGALPPVRAPKRESTVGRWIAGPVIMLMFAGGTAALARVVMPYGPAKPLVKVQGRLKLNTTPPGASVLVDGKVHPRFTPTVIEGDVGAAVRITFKLDGYAPKEVEVTVREGENPFAVKLDPSAPVAPPPKPVVEAPPPKPSSSRHHSSSTPKEAPASGKGTLTVTVRPWAIVLVDGTRLRQTPVRDFELAAGKHTIELVNEGKNRREKVQVTIKNGELEEIKRDWDKD
jgi:hypothetical protein